MSMIGRHHLEKGGVCQDSNSVMRLDNGWVVAAIADGLGSCCHSDTGSSIAVRETLDFVEKNCPDVWHDGSMESLLCLAFHSALKAVKVQAKEEGNPANDYGTTLSAIIYNGTNVAYGNIGDSGVLVLNSFGDIYSLSETQKGEFANETYPLHSGPEYWQFGTTNESICSLLMLTDGLLDVACPSILIDHDPEIYINFVRQFMDFNLMNLEDKRDLVRIKEDVKSFLSTDVPSVVTDDMTLVSIFNTEIIPDIKEEAYYQDPDWESLRNKKREELYGLKSCEDTEEINGNVVDEKVEIKGDFLKDDITDDIVISKFESASTQLFEEVFQ